MVKLYLEIDGGYWLDDYPFRAELDVLKQHN